MVALWQDSNQFSLNKPIYSYTYLSYFTEGCIKNFKNHYMLIMICCSYFRCPPLITTFFIEQSDHWNVTWKIFKGHTVKWNGESNFAKCHNDSFDFLSFLQDVYNNFSMVKSSLLALFIKILISVSSFCLVWEPDPWLHCFVCFSKFCFEYLP